MFSSFYGSLNKDLWQQRCCHAVEQPSGLAQPGSCSCTLLHMPMLGTYLRNLPRACPGTNQEKQQQHNRVRATMKMEMCFEPLHRGFENSGINGERTAKGFTVTVAYRGSHSCHVPRISNKSCFRSLHLARPVRKGSPRWARCS